VKLLTCTLSFFFIVSSGLIQGQPDHIEIGTENIVEIAERYQVDIFKIKAGFYNYLFLIDQNILLKKHKKNLDKLPHYAGYAYQTGEISFLEKEKYILTFNQISNKINLLSYDISIAENELKKMLKTDVDVWPLDDSLSKYISFEIIEFMENQMAALPDTVFDHFIELENMMIKIKKKEEELLFFTNHRLPYIEIMKKNTILKMENEEMEIAGFYDQMNKIYETRKEYLNILNEYNQLAIQIEKCYETIIDH